MRVLALIFFHVEKIPIRAQSCPGNLFIVPFSPIPRIFGFTDTVLFFEIARIILLLTKRGHFRRERGHGREVLPQYDFSDVRSDRGAGEGSQGSLTTPPGILAHRCQLRARLYRFSPDPRILKVIISEKCGTGPELLNVPRRERMRSYISILRSPDAGDDMAWDAGSTGLGICLHLPPGTSGIIRNSPEKKTNGNRLNFFEKKCSRKKDRNLSGIF